MTPKDPTDGSVEGRRFVYQGGVSIVQNPPHGASKSAWLEDVNESLDHALAAWLGTKGYRSRQAVITVEIKGNTNA
jgi:hypothetical protein